MSIILTIVASPEKLHDRVVLFCSSISNRLAISVTQICIFLTSSLFC